MRVVTLRVFSPLLHCPLPLGIAHILMTGMQRPGIPSTTITNHMAPRTGLWTVWIDRAPGRCSTTTTGPVFSQLGHMMRWIVLLVIAGQRGIVSSGERSKGHLDHMNSGKENMDLPLAPHLDHMISGGRGRVNPLDLHLDYRL